MHNGTVMPSSSVRAESLKQAYLVGLVALGFGMLLGSTWASRDVQLFGTTLTRSYAYFVAIVALLVAAVAFLRRKPRATSILKVSIALFVVHAATTFLASLFDAPGELFALGLVSSLFEGLLFACVCYLFVVQLVSLGGKSQAVAVALAFLIANVYDCLFIGAPPVVLAVQWVVGEASVLLVAWMLLYRVFSSRKDEHGLALEEGWFFDDMRGESEILRFGVAFAPCAPFALLVAVLMLIQGFFATTTGLGGVGENAFFNLSHGIFLVGVRFLVLAVCFVAHEVLTDRSVSVAAIVLWTAGLICTSAFSMEGGNVVGAAMLETGLYTLQVLALVVGLDYASHRSGASSAITCFFLALIFFNQITRYLAHFTPEEHGGSPAFSVSVAISFGLIVIVLLARWLVDAAKASSSTNAAGAPNGVEGESCTHLDHADSILRREIDFSRRFRIICDRYGLTERERDVLFETLHGYTIEAAADKLCLSKETVKTYLSRIYSRAGVNNKQGILNLIDAHVIEETPDRGD